MDTWSMHGFCGNDTTVFTDTQLYGDTYRMTSCFLDTLPVWISCGYAWMVAIPVVIFMRIRRSEPLPFSPLYIVKVGLCMVLVAMEVLHYNFRYLYGSFCMGADSQSTQADVSVGIKLATFTLMAGLIQIQRRCGKITSGPIFLFWLLLLWAELARFCYYITAEAQCLTQTSYYLYVLMVAVQLFVHCLAEQRPEMQHKDTERPNLVTVLLKTFWFDIMECIVYSWIHTGLYFLTPISLRHLIEYIDGKGTSDGLPWTGIFHGVLLVILMQAMSITYNVTIYHTSALGMRMKSALLYLIYKKALTVAKTETGISVGKIVNLVSVDSQKMVFATHRFYLIINMLPVMAVTAWELWSIVGGTACIAGMSVWVLSLPLNALIVAKQNDLQTIILELKSNRLKLMDEILRGVKVVKMYTWENVFIQKVQQIRNEEVAKVRQNVILVAISSTIATHSQFSIHLVLLTVYLLTSESHFISASTAFVSFAVLGVGKGAMVMMPSCLNTATQAYVALRRIECFLSSKDIDGCNTKYSNAADEKDTSICVKDGRFTWGREESVPSLIGINFSVRPGQLVAVVGHCGSGKSSLVSAVLGDMRKLDGSVVVKEAWIQNMTLRDNILFGREFVSSRYWQVLECCSLKPDLSLLDDGDQTEIGEMGTNISGGQKQRISLARAAYSNADVYILDDPLAAVDTLVGKDLFKNLISNRGLLKNKTRILVTNAVHWLPLVDIIIVMTDGSISEFGTYDELMSHNGDFAQFLLQYLVNDELPAGAKVDPEVNLLRAKMLQRVESVTSDGGGGVSSDNMTSRMRIKQLRKRCIRKRVPYGSMPVGNIPESAVPFSSHGEDLLTEEVVQEGTVKLKVFVDYVRAMGWVPAVLSVLLIVVSRVLSVCCTLWLTVWTEDPYLTNQSNLFLLGSHSIDRNASAGNSQNISSSETVNQAYLQRSDRYLAIYAVMGIIQALLLFLSYYLPLTRLVSASSVLHDSMLMSVLRSPMAFFDTVPIGRLLNRFSSDIDTMDNPLPESYRLLVSAAISVSAAMLVLAFCTPSSIFIIVPALLVIGLLLINPVSRKQKYRLYSPTTMTKAYLLVKEKRMSVKKASRVFNIPDTTLRDRILGKVDADTAVFGKAPVLDCFEESNLVAHFKCMASYGYGYTRQECVNIASDYAVHVGKRSKDKPFTMKWMRGFLKRWPELKVLKPRGLEHARAKCTSKEVVAQYFANLQETIRKHNLEDKPHLIFNVDEKGISIDHTPPHVVADSAYCPQAVTSGRSKTVTILGGGSASGVAIPPFFIFPGKRMRIDLLEGSSPGTDATVSETGWSNSVIFREYLENHFLKFIPGRQDGKILLLVDGHKSHVSVDLTQWAREKGIIIFILPAHTSHVLQPMDVSCYGPFEKIYNALCHRLMRESAQTISRDNICAIACKAYSKALTTDNVQSGFKRAGVYPLNPDAVPHVYMKPAEVFREDQKADCIDKSTPDATPNHAASASAPPADDQPPDSYVSLLAEKESRLMKLKSEKKAIRKTMSKIVSGRELSQNVETLMIEHETNQKPKKTTNIKKSGSGKKDKQISDVKTKKISTVKAGPSAVNLVSSDTDSDTDSDIDPADLCCKCKMFQPAELKQCTSLIFTKWAQCDKCQHWVHLIYCTPVRVVRRGDSFLCHHCEAEQ